MVARGWSLLVGMVLAECVLTKNSLNPLRTMVMNVRVLAKKFLQEVAMDKSGWNFLERASADSFATPGTWVATCGS